MRLDTKSPIHILFYTLFLLLLTACGDTDMREDENNTAPKTAEKSTDYNSTTHNDKAITNYPLSFYAWDGVENYSKLNFKKLAPTIYLNPVDHGKNLFIENAKKIQAKGGNIWLLLSGNPPMNDYPPNEYVDQQIDLIDKANENKNASILGISFDLEPWSKFDDLNTTQKRAKWKDWLKHLRNYHEQLYARGYKTSVTIPFWLYEIPKDTWPSSKSLFYEILKISDEVILMDYTTYPDRFLAYAKNELEYADTHNKQVKLAIEMTDLGEEKSNISFYKNSSKIDEILNLHISNSSFRGFVIHTIDAYVNAVR